MYIYIHGTYTSNHDQPQNSQKRGTSTSPQESVIQIQHPQKVAARAIIGFLNIIQEV